MAAFAFRWTFSPMLVHLRKSVRHDLLGGDEHLLSILRTPETSGSVLARLEQLNLPWRLGVLAPKPAAAPDVAYPTECSALRPEEALQRVRVYPGCRGLAVENARTAQRALESGGPGMRRTPTPIRPAGRTG